MDQSNYTSFSRWHDRLARTVGPDPDRAETGSMGYLLLAQYPSAAAFVEMVLDPVYREAMRHRQAAVENSRLIRLSPAATGNAFHGAMP